jgi:hypothetical protein
VAQPGLLARPRARARSGAWATRMSMPSYK